MSHRNHPSIDYRDVVDADTQFIDVREPVEVAERSLDGIVNIPLGDLPGRTGDLDPARRVVLLCRSGGRSGQAADFLSRSGFVDVINLAGGMLAIPSSAEVPFVPGPDGTGAAVRSHSNQPHSDQGADR